MTSQPVSGRRSFREMLGAVTADRRWLVLLLVVLAFDVACMAYFATAKTMYEFGDDRSLYNYKALLVTTDGGYPELFNYLQTLFVVVLLVRLARWTRQPVYVVLGLMFVLVLFDDALEIHEYVGKHLGAWLDPPRVFGLRRRDYGEVLAWAIAGLVVVPALFFSIRRSAAVHRGYAYALLYTFGALLFCAIGLDLLYRPLKDLFPGAGVLLDTFEDGGEMLSITFTWALALGALRLQRR